jgi:protease PrsW
VVVRVAADDGRVLDVTGGELLIGRCASADLSLDDRMVSRHHARLEVDPDGRSIVLRDLGSRHGTYLDGQRLRGPTAVKVPARVELGGATVHLLPPTGPGSQPPGKVAPLPAPPPPSPGAVPAPPGGAPLTTTAPPPVAAPPPPNAVAWPPPMATAPAPTRGRAGLIVGVIVMALLGLATLLVTVVEVGATGAGLSLLVATLPAPLVFAFVRVIDRHEPEPLGMLALVFLYGATAAVFFAGILNVLGEEIVAAALGPAIGEFFGLAVAAPFVEEGLKAGALLFIVWRRRSEFNGVIDGLVYGAVVGMGFAVMEDMLFYGQALLEGGDAFAATVVVRGVFSPFAHSLFTAMTGLGLALSLEMPGRRWFPAVAGLAGAIGLHALWNGSAYFEVLPFVYFVVFVPMMCLVMVVAWRAVRWEGRLVTRMLTPDVGTGLLTEPEVAALGTTAGRRAVVRHAGAVGGAPAKRRVRDFQLAATELAFVRRRMEVARAATPEQRGEEAALMERVWRLKAGIGAVPQSVASS